MRKGLTYIFLLGLLLALAVPARAAEAQSRVGRVSTAGGSLNVRAAASTGAGVLASLQRGSYVTLIGRSGDWWQVEYADDRYGYCHSDYIAEVSASAATVATNSGSLNVRSGPGTGYAKIASLPKGEAVLVLDTAGDWSRILFQGTKTGYVSSRYLSETYASVALWVPNLKQTDSRWAALEVGQSGKTFAQIGCATTAIAMVESHRRGYTVYPNDMGAELKYTADGSVYWPGHYTAFAGSGDWLAAVYSRLTQGKPVLLGLRNSAGGQHWVVVTGFAGGSTLDPAQFTVRDPGTYSRTDLQQLLELYPVFYKFFVY